MVKSVFVVYSVLPDKTHNEGREYMKTKMMVFGMIAMIAIVSVSMGTAHAQFSLPSLAPYFGWYKIKITEKMYHWLILLTDSG